MERLSYRPSQLSVEAYVRSVREEESRTQVWRPYRPSMLAASEGFILIRDDVLRLNNPYVGIEPSPRACRGGGVEENYDPQVLQPMYWL
jgi:hypothetical protein